MNNGKYKPETVDKICKFLRMGSTARGACGYAGICEDTYYDWIKNHSEFSELVKKAKDESLAADLERLDKLIAEGNSTALFYRLNVIHDLPQKINRLVEEIKQEKNEIDGRLKELEKNKNP
jgi:hypothetical protein